MFASAVQYQSVIVDPAGWSYKHRDEDSQSVTSTTSSSQEESVESAGEHGGEDILATAMLKEEIRCNIMHKRIHKGLGGININWKKSGSDNMTSDEEAKRKTRRERNRLAASRCRERRREKTYVLVQETEELDSSNRELLEEIRQLEIERQQLLAVMEAHKHGRCECTQQTLTTDDLIIDP